jgi:hypothetical protein
VDQTAEPIATTDAGHQRSFFGLVGAQRTIGPLAVGVVDIDPEHVLEVAAVEDQQPVETLERTVRTKRSAIAFAFGACTGVFTIGIPSLRKTSSKRAAVLAVAVADQEAEARVVGAIDSGSPS